MAGSIFDAVEDDFNDHVLKVAAMAQPAGIFVALSTTTPADDATNITEPVGNGYARVDFTDWIVAASRRSGNNTLIQFPIATGSQGTMTYWVLYDAITGGNPLMYGDLVSPVVINTGNRFEFAPDTLRPTVAVAGWSDYLAHAAIDHILLISAFAQPAALWVAGVTVATVDADTGSTITEPGAGAYVRVNFEDWVASSGGASSNNTDIVWPVATASWGNILGAPILDASSAGNLLLHGSIDSPQVIDIDEIMQFDAGDLDITLD